MSDWWRSAVTYQVYLRSFADGDGDGVGDLPGLISRLAYLADLGVDAIWINPWYPSPQRDGGYDVIRYDDIDPLFGALADADRLIDEAHRRGLRVLIDIVPNHASAAAPEFQRALTAGPGSPERELFHFRDGRGLRGELPPNDWQSIFGGEAWTRTETPDGQWYLHLFDASQPDWNWDSPAVRRYFTDVLRFWFDRGVDGFRIDVAHGLFKRSGLPDDHGVMWAPGEHMDTLDHPAWDRPELHHLYRRWRHLADEYQPPRVFVAEAYVPHPARLARFVRGDELHTAFNFDYLVAPWNAAEIRASIERTLRSLADTGAPPTWVQANHDLVRMASRFARADQSRLRTGLKDFAGEHADFAVGTRRARAAALLTLSLPGCAYLYQGEELGLPEVEDLDPRWKHDPAYLRSGGLDPGRDGCRVPLPWSGQAPPFGFGPSGTTPWLPQPMDWAQFTAEAQIGNPASMHSLVRSALTIRRSHPALGDGSLHWIEAGGQVVCFGRHPGFVCLTNIGAAPVDMPTGAGVLLASEPVEARMVPPDTTVWLRVG